MITYKKRVLHVDLQGPFVIYALCVCLHASRFIAIRVLLVTLASVLRWSGGNRPTRRTSDGKVDLGIGDSDRLIDRDRILRLSCKNQPVSNAKQQDYGGRYDGDRYFALPGACDDPAILFPVRRFTLLDLFGGLFYILEKVFGNLFKV